MRKRYFRKFESSNMRFAAGVAKLSTRHKINEERERDRKGKSLGKSHAY